jgi:hypothetical protein
MRDFMFSIKKSLCHTMYLPDACSSRDLHTNDGLQGIKLSGSTLHVNSSPNKRRAPDSCVRIPSSRHDELKKFAKEAKATLSPLLVELTREAVDLCLNQNWAGAERCRRSHQNEELRKLAKAIVSEEISKKNHLAKEAVISEEASVQEEAVVPKEATVPVRIHLAAEDLQAIAEVVKRMAWSQSEVVWQAIRAALFIVAYGDELKEVPPLMGHYAGVTRFYAVGQEEWLDKLRTEFSSHPSLSSVEPKSPTSSMNAEIELATGIQLVRHRTS